MDCDVRDTHYTREQATTGEVKAKETSDLHTQNSSTNTRQFVSWYVYVPTRCENSNQTSARTSRATPMLRVRLRGCYPLHQQSLITLPIAFTCFPSL